MSWFTRLKRRGATQSQTRSREEEKARYLPYLPLPEQQALVFAVIDATYEMNEGRILPSGFVDIIRKALVEGDSRAWQNSAEWLEQTTPDLPEIGEMWTELASHPDWRIRWRVACLLYKTIPEQLSHRLFATLRNDRSSKVREYAVQRYEWCPDEQGMARMLDATQFDARVSAGEIRF